MVFTLVGAFVVYCNIQFHIPHSSGQLVNTIPWKTKHRIYTATILLFFCPSKKKS
jgi:hypothetical protein